MKRQEITNISMYKLSSVAQKNKTGEAIVTLGTQSNHFHIKIDL
jgi:hypothetical protein